jgi:nucleoside-diphosphate-sugar epimerase
MARYLVTGGAGFLGINLVRYLLDRGQQVTSLDVVPFDYADCRDRVRVVTGDVREPDAVDRAAEDAHIVVHCAAALPLYKPEDIFSTEVEGTRNVAAAAERHARRLVHVSTTAVYGIPDHHPIYEDDPLDGVGPYGEAKIEAEKVCLDLRERGYCVPIVRPKSFVGPERLGVFAMLYDWAKDGKGFPMVGRGDNLYQLLDVEDLCEAIWLCATLEPERVNDTFNIGAKEFRTMREDFQAVLDAAGYGKKVHGFPAGPVIWTLRILERLGLSPLYKWVYETACEDSFVSVEKAQRVLGWEPKYSNQDALLRNFRWYLDNLDRFEGASGISHRVPWSQGILKLAKLFF